MMNRIKELQVLREEKQEILTDTTQELREVDENLKRFCEEAARDRKRQKTSKRLKRMFGQNWFDLFDAQKFAKLFVSVGTGYETDGSAVITAIKGQNIF